MKRKLMQDALSEIHDKHILEAVTYKKRRILPWVSTAAAVLALIIGLQFLQLPVAVQASAVVLAEPARVDPRPQLEDYSDIEQFRDDTSRWMSEHSRRLDTAQQAMEQMEPFVRQSMQLFLKDQEENQLFSPVNAYFALAMTAELTAGQTQQQLLDALGTGDLETLRTQASALWESVYVNSSKEITYRQRTQGSTSEASGNAYVYVRENQEVITPANSLWLDKSLSYNSRPLTALARHYYASVYQQDLSGEQAVKDIQTWLNQNTGGLLEDAVSQVQLPEETIMALYSTIYFRSRWVDEFTPGNNSHGTFHGTNGNTAATFMNKSFYQTHYYFGKDFGAVALDLKNGSKMWFLLPDEGKTLADILDDSQYLDMITAPEGQWGSRKYMLVNLSVPKFDVQNTKDLREGLEAMGITHLFDPAAADFSTALNTPAYMTSANQSVRVTVDEEGVTAASYVELPAAGTPMPPEELIDFVLDRPFLFVITKGNIPLFAGAINQIHEN